MEIALRFLDLELEQALRSLRSACVLILELGQCIAAGLQLVVSPADFAAGLVRLAHFFLGFAPGIIGWALLDLIARCLFALDRPRLPMYAAAIPLTVNLTAMLAFGRIKDPRFITVGASVGLLAAFAALFLAIHLRRPPLGRIPALSPDLTGAVHEQS